MSNAKPKLTIPPEIEAELREREALVERRRRQRDAEAVAAPGMLAAVLLERRRTRQDLTWLRLAHAEMARAFGSADRETARA